MRETYTTSDKHFCNIYPKKQMKHWEQKVATYVYNHCNICNIPIYFYNIHMKHFQHTYETSETLAFCNMGEARAGRIQPLRSEPLTSGSTRAPPASVPATARKHRRSRERMVAGGRPPRWSSRGTRQHCWEYGTSTSGG
jgi:hypothetical protein